MLSPKTCTLHSLTYSQLVQTLGVCVVHDTTLRKVVVVSCLQSPGRFRRRLAPPTFLRRRRYDGILQACGYVVIVNVIVIVNVVHTFHRQDAPSSSCVVSLFPGTLRHRHGRSFMYDFFKKLAVTYLSLHVMVMERDVCFLLLIDKIMGP